MRQALWNVALVKIARKSTERRPWWILRRFANKELLTKCLVNWATIKNFITCCPGKVAMKNTQFTLCRRIPHNILLYLNLFKFTAWRQFSAIKRLNPLAQSKKRRRENLIWEHLFVIAYFRVFTNDTLISSSEKFFFGEQPVFSSEVQVFFLPISWTSMSKIWHLNIII